MATTAIRPGPPAEARPSEPAGTEPGHSRSPIALGAALGVAVLYAMFAEGAIGIPQESLLQIGVAAIALAALAALLYGGGLRVSAGPAAVAGLALLGLFALWSGLSVSWSVSPDQSWLELNRAVAYGLVVALALVLGSSLPRAAERVALAYLAIATVVALYALGGKLFPWLQIPGILDLDHTDRFSRLRAPLGYWNALGLACAMGVPIGLRATLALAGRARIAALIALVVLLTTLALTYSRGGLLVLVAMVGLLVAVGPDRLRLLALTGIGVLAAAPPVVCVVLLDDLKTDGLAASARTGDGLLLALALAAGLALALVLARWLFARGELRLSERAAARTRRAALAAAVAVPLIVLAVLALSDRGIGGTVDHQLDEFSAAKFDPQNDPSRVLRTNSGNRWVWWQEAAGAFSDRPVEGHGAGSFPLVHRAYRDNPIEVRQPHSVPMEFLAETGLVGALLALGGLLALVVAGVRGVRARGPGREHAFAAALLAVALGWLLHSLVDWDWDIPAVTLVALIALGVIGARPREPQDVDGPARPVRGRGPLLAAGTLAACVVAALAALPALSEHLTDEALARAGGGTATDLREAQETAALAKRLNPFAVEPVWAQAAIAERGNQPAAAAGLLVEAVERQPSNPGAWTRLGRFQLMVGDSRGALRSTLTAIVLDRFGTLGSTLFFQSFYDHNRSASATGTPLPERLEPLVPAPSTPPDRGGGDTQPDDTPRGTPAPPPPPAPDQPAPAPAPAPDAPRNDPAPPPSDDEGEPFRLEG